ncbi:hypothetical protein B296_00045088 [Ensete ventricosum]|uniref:Uncharacterized protein n=1 Tax=Ensete ventricosum TaxID=4639 RepID=A0A426WZL6_ENSVE|nr:hypothetical protein B296_00045088 [Ensete ventricosum]
MDKGRGGWQRGDLDGRNRRSCGCSRRSRGCSVPVTLRKKTLAMPKDEVRSCCWTVEGYHRWRRGSRSWHQRGLATSFMARDGDVGANDRAKAKPG